MAWSMVSKAAERSERVRAVTDPLAMLRKSFSIMFSISRLESGHKASFIKVSL